MAMSDTTVHSWIPSWSSTEWAIVVFWHQLSSPFTTVWCSNRPQNILMRLESRSDNVLKEGCLTFDDYRPIQNPGVTDLRTQFCRCCCSCCPHKKSLAVHHFLLHRGSQAQRKWTYSTWVHLGNSTTLPTSPLTWLPCIWVTTLRQIQSCTVNSSLAIMTEEHQGSDTRTAWKKSFGTCHIEPYWWSTLAENHHDTLSFRIKHAVSSFKKICRATTSRIKDAEGRTTTLYHQTLTRPSVASAVTTLTLSPMNMSAVSVDHSLLDPCSSQAMTFIHKQIII